MRSAFDVAVTSFMRGPPCTSDPGAEAVQQHLEKYSKFKKEYLDTARVCATQELAFAPLVFDAHGSGWDEAVEDLLRRTAQRIAAASRIGAQSSNISIPELLSQRLSVALQTASARATLRRLTGGLDSFQ